MVQEVKQQTAEEWWATLDTQEQILRAMDIVIGEHPTSDEMEIRLAAQKPWKWMQEAFDARSKSE